MTVGGGTRLDADSVDVSTSLAADRLEINCFNTVKVGCTVDGVIRGGRAVMTAVAAEAAALNVLDVGVSCGRTERTAVVDRMGLVGGIVTVTAVTGNRCTAPGDCIVPSSPSRLPMLWQ